MAAAQTPTASPASACCYYSESGDFCGACDSQAPAGSYCTTSETRCADECGGHWCGPPVFTEVPVFGRWISIAASSDGTRCAAVESPGRIWRSTDSSRSWEITSASNTHWRDIASSSGGSALAAVEEFGSIWLSSDSGDTWTAGSERREWRSVAMSEKGSVIAAAEGGGNIWLTSDSGATWRKDSIGATQRWYGVAMSLDGAVISAAAFDGQIWQSLDSGSTWKELVVGDGTNDWSAITCSSDGKRLAAAAYGGNIWLSDSGGGLWTEVVLGSGKEKWYDVTMSAGGIQRRSFEMNPRRRRGRGVEMPWRQRAAATMRRGDRRNASGTTLAATVDNGDVWWSATSGTTWAADTSVGATQRWRGIAMSSDGAKSVATAYTGNIWRSGEDSMLASLSAADPVPFKTSTLAALAVGAAGVGLAARVASKRRGKPEIEARPLQPEAEATPLLLEVA